MSDYIVKQGGGESIQSAIDQAHAAGGGRVVVEPGLYPCATITMKSFVELHLTAGAKLKGSSNPDDYDDFRNPGFDSFAPENSRKCLLAAANAEHIAVTGQGEINGNGPAFYDTNVPEGDFFKKPPRPRPRMVQFCNCRNVTLQDVSFIDSPGWTIWLLACQDVHVHRARVEGCQQMINNDGLDIDDCRRVTVSDSFFRTGDDCIILRAIKKAPDHHALCQDVTVTNCVLDSRCQGIRIGCPSDDTICHCTFSNLVIRGQGNGININNPKRYLRPNCTGYLDLNHILFNNLTIESRSVPIWINVEPGVKLRRLANLTFSNIRIEADQPCMIEGCPETIIQDVRFSEMVAAVKSEQAVVAKYCRHLVLNQVELSSNC